MPVERHRPAAGPRRLILVVGLAAIVGLGCMSIRLAPPADERAVQQFAPEAEKGDRVAQYQLASSYRYGSSGLPLDMNKAVLWMRKSAEAGNGDAQFALGDMLAKGWSGTPPAPDEALLWFRRAAESHLGNRLWLAEQLDRGGSPLGVTDRAAARELYLVAAGQSRLARHRLGQMAERAGSMGEALKWYAVAASDDDVARLEKGMKRVEIERVRQEAARWKP
jgi:TPR repeat protein